MEDINSLKSKILDNQYSLPKHIGVSSRMATYWKQKGILPFFQAGKNGKMNIPQSVWLSLVKELSEYGINTTKLAELAYTVWKKPFEEGYFEQKVKDEISYLKKVDKENENISTLESFLKDEMFLETQSQEITPFADAVVDCILQNSKPLSFYYFLKSGECYICNDNQAITDKLIRMTNNDSYLCIPLTSFIKETVILEIKQIKKDLPYLSQVENQIREIIMFKSPKYIELFVDDDKIKPLIIRDSHKSAKQLADFFLNNKLPRNARLLIAPRAQDNYKLTILTK